MPPPQGFAPEAAASASAFPVSYGEADFPWSGAWALGPGSIPAEQQGQFLLICLVFR